MARSTDTIQSLIIADVQADPVLNPGGSGPNLQSASKRAIWRAWTRIFAIATNILENIMDIFKSDVEAIAAVSAGASNAWLQDKAFSFQYDSTSPQVIQLINTVPVYPLIDATKRIISRCSVSTDLSNNVLIKVAKQNPPIGLVTDEISAIQSYFNIIGGAGITYLLSSGNADQLYINADVYYDGQYQAVILANITASLTNFLANLSSQNNFNGKVYMSAIEDAIRNTVGVNDVVLQNVKSRQDATPFVDATSLILDAQVLSRLWQTIAGYIILETTTSETLADSLNLIAQ